MPTVSQIRMQATANSVHNAMAKLGSTPGSSAMSGGFEAFLAALDQTRAARLNASSDSERFGAQNALPVALRGQNLPISNKTTEDTA